jgi:hypothetical protein
MYVAKVDDRGRASCVYMFDEQLVNFDDMFSKSYFMKKSSDKQSMVDFSHEWNSKHKDLINHNNMLHYVNVVCKGILQAPALVVLYACVVMGAMLLFGSENFYHQIDLYGVEAFGNIRTVATITYVVSAVLGLLASLTTYNNVRYKFARCIISVLTFLIISPVFFNKVFFATSNTVITLTIIMIAGCFFIRFILDRLIVSNIRKNTEKLIRDEHHIIDGSGTQTAFYDAAAGSENAEDVEVDALEPIMNRVRNNHRLTQYRKR